MKKTKEQYQTVTITLSNGKKGTFMGKVLITPEELGQGVTVVMPIQFTEPKDLPEDMSFGLLEETKEDKS